MITAAATVAVYVDDTDASLGFWVDRVGFEVRVDRRKDNTLDNSMDKIRVH